MHCNTWLPWSIRFWLFSNSVIVVSTLKKRCRYSPWRQSSKGSVIDQKRMSLSIAYVTYEPHISRSLAYEPRSRDSNSMHTNTLFIYKVGVSVINQDSLPKVTRWVLWTSKAGRLYQEFTNTSPLFETNMIVSFFILCNHATSYRCRPNVM